MSTRSTRALTVAALLAISFPGAVAAEDESEVVQVFFVVSAGSGSVEGDTLRLDAVPSVLWFTDQPDGSVGQIEPADLEALWKEGQGSVTGDRPGAVLSILDAATAADAVIELTGIASQTDDVGAPDDMTFTFEVLEGELPEGAIGTASLVIPIEQASPLQRLDGLILNFRTVSGR